jgi:hypothetical protein
VSGYARALPHLGFDPAPGDVGLTRDLARRHHEVAQEVRQVLTQVDQVNLASWQGRAGQAVQALRATFPPALRSVASTADTLQEATSRWADQLSGFQAEADALERQAARAAENQQALQIRQAGLPPGSQVLSKDLEAASAAVTGIERRARDLHERYLEAAAKTAEDIKPKNLWERTEPVRTVLEAVLAPFDIVVADHWIGLLEKAAGQPAEWVAELGEQISEIEAAMRAGKSPVDALIQAAKAAESTGGKLDAWDAFAPAWLKTAAGRLAEIKGTSYTLSGLGLVADAGTLISPQDKGAMGVADRTVAGVNGTLIVLNMTMDEIPVVGEVTLGPTGIYLAGDFLYHHFTPFHDVANEVGHATVKVTDGLVHGAKSAWHSVTSTIGSWF